MNRTVRKIALCATIIGLLSGCNPVAFIKKFKYKVPIETVQMTAEPDANDQSPIAVDLIVFLDKNLMGEIIKLPAPKYFEMKDDIQNNHYGMYELWHWDIMPGQVMKEEEININSDGPEGAAIFAKYINGGENRINASKIRHLKIRFTKDKMILVVDPRNPHK